MDQTWNTSETNVTSAVNRVIPPRSHLARGSAVGLSLRLWHRSGLRLGRFAGRDGPRLRCDARDLTHRVGLLADDGQLRGRGVAAGQAGSSQKQPGGRILGLGFD